MKTEEIVKKPTDKATKVYKTENEIILNDEQAALFYRLSKQASFPGTQAESVVKLQKLLEPAYKREVAKAQAKNGMINNV